jgi:hypothetical protein
MTGEDFLAKIHKVQTAAQQRSNKAELCFYVNTEFYNAMKKFSQELRLQILNAIKETPITKLLFFALPPGMHTGHQTRGFMKRTQWFLDF